MKNFGLNKNSKEFNFWSLVVIFLAFYIGVAWGKRDNSMESTPRQEISSFVKNLSDPKAVFSGDPDKNKPGQVNFDIFWEAWRKVDRSFYDEDKLVSEDMVHGAISGMVRSLNDPYSSFMSREETEDFKAEMEGSFEGIGAELGIRENVLTVIAPIEGMPAQKAGLRAGDKIIKINNSSTSELDIDEAVRMIRGEKGTEVILTVFRDESEDRKTLDIKIIRDRIEIKSVTYSRKDGDIGYVRIKKFAEDTTKEFNKVVSMMIADNVKGVVLDVRNNPGGFLNVSVEIASKFVSKKEPVVWEESRNGVRRSYEAMGGDSLSSMPVVVLVNEGSASASEIVAGALKDLKNHKIIGKKTFGKGSVQQMERLADGSSLRITIAKWLTPSGKSINEVGINPDIEVEMTIEDYENEKDPQLDRAMEEIKKIINQVN